MMNQVLKSIFCLTAFSALLAAQVSTGSIVGSITDPTGATVPGAKISIRNAATGSEQKEAASETGLFRVPFLQPGIYSVKVEAPGFSAADIRNVTVELGKEVTVNARLEVGATTETVTVEAGASVVETSSAQVTNTVSSEKIMFAPRADRGVDNLALLSPGVQPGMGFTNNNGTSLSVNGQRTRANNFLLEGQDNNDTSVGGPGLFMSNPEVISEFSIITNQFSAEYGRNAGAIVNIGLRGGDNQFHVTGNYRMRNDQALGAMTNFQRRAGNPSAPKLIDNYLGGAVTGRVIKDRWFFMGYGYNNKRRTDNRAEATAASLTPTPAGLETLGRAFPNSPTVRALRELGPFGVKLGNVQAVPFNTQTIQSPAGPVNVEMGRIIRTFSQPYDSLEYGTRQDFNITQNQRLSGRYLYQERVTQAATGSGTTGYLVNTPGITHNAGGTHTWTINPTLVNEVRFSYQKNGFFFEGGPSFPFAEISKNIASFSFDNGNLGFGLANNLPQYRQVKRWQFQDNISKQIGRHFIKTGLQISQDRNEFGFLPNVNGSYFYADLQNFANNIPRQLNMAAGEALQRPTQTDNFYYIQDDWKVTNNLTLNIGLRYEFSGQPLNVLNDLTVKRESDPAKALFNSSLPIDARTVRRLNADKNNFQPRLGFAYASKSQSWWMKDTVIRGGYSVMNEPAFYNMLLNVQSSAPVALAYSLTGASVPVTSDFTGANMQRITRPPAGIDPRTLNQTQFDGSFRLPRIQSWSIGMQRRIGQRQGFEVRYVGTKGDDQFMTVNGNPLISAFTGNGWGSLVPSGITAGTNTACANCTGRQDANFAAIRTRNNAAFNRYHGLQTRYDARLFNQFLIGSSYTYSKNIDNVSEIFESAGNGSVVISQSPFDLVNGERGLSNIDLKHVWTMNFSWEMPWMKTQKGFLGKVVGGWQIAGITSWYGGRPMQPLQTNSGAGTVNDRTFLGAFIGARDQVRPFTGNPNAPVNTVGRILPSGLMVNQFNQTQTVSLNDVRWVYNNADSARFFRTPFGIGRNVLRGPRTFTQDASFYKNLNVTERLKLQFRFEATNLFNNTNLLIPNLNIEQGVAAFLNPQETESTPRVVTVGMRIFW